MARLSMMAVVLAGVMKQGKWQRFLQRDTPSSHWLRELATLLDAGVAPAEALGKTSVMELPAGKTAQRQLRQGHSLSVVFGRSLMPHAADRTMLMAAEAGGFVPSQLKKLAQLAEARAKRVAQLQVRWRLFMLVLAIAWLAGTVVAYFSPEVHLFGGVLVNTFMCTVILMVCRWINFLMFQDSWWWLDTMVRLGQLHNPLGQQLMLAHWLQLLSLQLSAGLDAAMSLRNMVGLVPFSAFKASVRRTEALVVSGRSITYALMEANLVSGSAVVAPLHAGEQSGRLVEAMQQAATLAEQSLRERTDSLVFWAPKVMYVFVALFAMRIIFGAAT
jgi:type II secretory pathway component PulF